MSNKVVDLSEYRVIKNEVNDLSEKMINLLLERDELRYVILRNIETDYNSKFLFQEELLAEAKHKIIYLQNKIELLNGMIEEGGIDENRLDAFDEKYKDEFTMFIGQRKHNTEMLEQGKNQYITGERAEALKQLYGEIARVAHPDFQITFNMDNIKLFNETVAAYKNSDIEKMKELRKQMDEMEIVEPEKITADKMIEVRDRLTKRIKSITESIDVMKNKFPYNAKDFVNDEEACAQYMTDMKAELAQYREVIPVLEAEVDKLLA